MYVRYGFTETAGNFQQYNFGEGGEGDAIIANAQNMSGFNNAAFTSPPDGLNGYVQVRVVALDRLIPALFSRCHMCLWDTDSSYPDGAVEASIVIHEISHDLSMRLTGGQRILAVLAGGSRAVWVKAGEVRCQNLLVYLSHTLLRLHRRYHLVHFDLFGLPCGSLGRQC